MSYLFLPHFFFFSFFFDLLALFTSPCPAYMFTPLSLSSSLSPSLSIYLSIYLSFFLSIYLPINLTYSLYPLLFLSLTLLLLFFFLPLSYSSNSLHLSSLLTEITCIRFLNCETDSGQHCNSSIYHL